MTARFPALADASLPRPYAHGCDFVTLTELDELEKAVAAGNAEAKVTASPGCLAARCHHLQPVVCISGWRGLSTATDMKIWATEMGTGSLTRARHPAPALDFGAGRYGLGVRPAGAWVTPAPCPVIRVSLSMSPTGGEHLRRDQPAGST